MEKPLYRYFADLKTGQFIFVVRACDARDWPPPGYPVIELSQEAVRELFDKEFD